MVTKSHNGLVNKESSKYNDDWIIIKELRYGGFKFDLFAFNPKTKQVNIAEILIGENLNEDKIQFAQSLGDLKVITLDMPKVKQKDYQPILKIFSNKFRIAILELLNQQGKQSWVEIKKIIGNTDGQFDYHLKMLRKHGLVNTINNGEYNITELGVKTLELIYEMGSLFSKTN